MIARELPLHLARSWGISLWCVGSSYSLLVSSFGFGLLFFRAEMRCMIEMPLVIFLQRLVFLGGNIREGLPELLHRSEEHTSELQSRRDLVCRLLLEKKKNTKTSHASYMP